MEVVELVNLTGLEERLPSSIIRRDNNSVLLSQGH